MDASTLTYLMGGAVDLTNGMANAYADSSRANFVANQFMMNANIAKVQGAEAVVQGKEEQEVSQERTAQLSGQQQVAEAAQGVDVKTGTSTITRQQTGEIGGKDFLTIGNNSFLKGLGFQFQSLSDTAQAQQEQAAGQQKSSSDILGGVEGLFQDSLKAVSTVPGLT